MSDSGSWKALNVSFKTKGVTAWKGWPRKGGEGDKTEQRCAGGKAKPTGELISLSAGLLKLLMD